MDSDLETTTPAGFGQPPGHPLAVRAPLHTPIIGFTYDAISKTVLSRKILARLLFAPALGGIESQTVARRRPSRPPILGRKSVSTGSEDQGFESPRLQSDEPIGFQRAHVADKTERFEPRWLRSFCITFIP